jgi:hypothetical protein
MHRLLVLLLLIPNLAFAAWTSDVPTEQEIEDFTQTFTYTYSAIGESGTQDVSVCDSPTVTINGANTVTIYSCTESGQALSKCRTAANATLSSFGPERVSIPGGFILARVTTLIGASTITATCTVRNQTFRSGAWSARANSAEHVKCVTIEAMTDADINVPIYATNAAIEVTEVGCIITEGGTGTMRLTDASGSTIQSATCQTGSTWVWIAATGTTALTASEGMEVDVTSASGVGWGSLCFKYRDVEN